MTYKNTKILFILIAIFLATAIIICTVFTIKKYCFSKKKNIENTPDIDPKIQPPISRKGEINNANISPFQEETNSQNNKKIESVITPQEDGKDVNNSEPRTKPETKRKNFVFISSLMNLSKAIKTDYGVFTLYKRASAIKHNPPAFTTIESKLISQDGVLNDEEIIEMFRSKGVEAGINNESILHKIGKDIDRFYDDATKDRFFSQGNIKSAIGFHTSFLRWFIYRLVNDDTGKEFSIGKKTIEYFLEKEKNIPENFRYGVNSNGVHCCPCWDKQDTLLIELICEGDLRAIKLMDLFPDVDPFIKDDMKKNALHFIVAKGRKDKDTYNQFQIFTKILTHEKITDRIDDVDGFGNTALHIACARRDSDYIELLLQVGANPKIKNQKNQSAIDILNADEKDRLLVLMNIVRPNENFAEKSIAEMKDRAREVASFDDKMFNSNVEALQDRINNLPTNHLEIQKDVRINHIAFPLK